MVDKEKLSENDMAYKVHDAMQRAHHNEGALGMYTIVLKAGTNEIMMVHNETGETWIIKVLSAQVTTGQGVKPHGHNHPLNCRCGMTPRCAPTARSSEAQQEVRVVGGKTARGYTSFGPSADMDPPVVYHLKTGDMCKGRSLRCDPTGCELPDSEHITLAEYMVKHQTIT